MNANGAAALARSIGVFSVAQMLIAAALVATGFVHLLHGMHADAVGVPVGVAAGLLLYAVLAAGDPVAPGRARRRSVVVLMLLLAGVSIAEEILWRGFALERLRSTAGPAIALVATTIGFAASHAATQGWSGIRYHLVTGLAMGLACVATGSLLSALATHLSYNLMFVRRVALQGSIAR